MGNEIRKYYVCGGGSLYPTSIPSVNEILEQQAVLCGKYKMLCKTG